MKKLIFAYIFQNKLIHRIHFRRNSDWNNLHYEHTSMQYTENFFPAVKIENFTRKKFDFFNTFAQNIHCRYTLEPPRPGGSNEYPQCIFWIKIS